MANTVKLKRSAVQGKVPTTGDLSLGELALNTNDGVLFFKRDVSGSESVVKVATTTNLLSYTRVTSNTTAVSRQSYIADTSGGTFTITLPASPSTGDWVTIVDGASFQTTALTVGRNSSTIADAADNLSLNIEGVSVTLVYDGSTWEVYTQVGANGGDQSGLVTGSSTTTFTNKTISGSSNTLSNIGNSSLTNSSVTINGTAVSLGSSTTVTAAAGTLTGTTLNSSVVSSSLTSVGTLTGLTSSGLVEVTYTGAGSQSSLKLGGYNSKGGTGYHDFLQITNGYGSATNPNKFLRLTSNGTLEVLNSAYTASILNLADNGLLTLPGTASVTNGTATSNGLNIGTHGTVFDDGNFHVHSTSGALWLNANDGSDIIVGTQTNSGTSRLAANNFVLDAGYGSRAPVYGVRAWINCGYVGSTMTTRASGNMSVSRTGVGVYVFTFGTAMPDRNYSINCTAQTPATNSDVAANIAYNVTPSTTGFTIHTARYGTGQVDVSELHVQVVR